MPQISVIVPVYEVEKYINRCVDSILAQTFTDFELILVDDGSPDNCGAICDDYAAKDSRVRVIHQKNGGLSAARNTGIDWSFSNSESEWVSFVDSDDWVHPKYLEVLYQAAIRARSDIAIGDFESTEGGNPYVDTTKLDMTIWDVEELYCKHNVLATVAWGKLYRKNCFKDIRYPNGKIHEDEFVTYRILFCNKSVPVIRQPLYSYYQNSEGIMHQKWSRKRLACVQAFILQIWFFWLRNCPQALHNRIRKLSFWIEEHVDLCQSRADRMYLIFIQKCNLLCWKSHFPLSTHAFYYNKYFSISMWVFYTSGALLTKIRRINEKQR